MTSGAVFRSMLNRVHSLSRDEVVKVIDSSMEFFKSSSSIARIGRPEKRLTICGDIHGQYNDLSTIFHLNGCPDSRSNPYMFNGDFVDRGPNSKSCILTLLLWNLADPGSVLLNRGNHELVEMNAHYGFKSELKDDGLFRAFNSLFDLLPVGHVIGEKIFCVHGGIPKDPVLLSSDVERFRDELLWNDPSDRPGVSSNPRGHGIYRFGPDITQRFLDINKLDLVVRSHEMVHEGFRISQNGKCVTVFSASNYAGYYDNKGAYLHIAPDMTWTGHSFNSNQAYHVSKL